MNHDWFALDIPDHIDLGLPGTYRWSIVQRDGTEETYFGMGTTIESRLASYLRNVDNMIAAGHWHDDPTKDFRPIHYALRLAREHGWAVTFSALANCAAEDLNHRKRDYIATFNPTLNGRAGRARIAEIEAKLAR